MVREMVRLETVEKRYGPVTALEATDLAVQEGEFLTLLGPSGSGKTTILNLISGTTAPTTGRIWIGGSDVTRVPANKRRLGMVFQNYALLPHMTVFENIAFPLRVRRVRQAEIRRKVASALEMVRLPDIASRKPKELSGGQQQRVAIARCLVYNPDLILMDEPLGALDKKLRDQMQLEIKRLHSQLGVTLLYVTHDQGEALVMSDRICLMNQGRVEQIGTPDELYFRPTSVFAADFLGESNILDAEVERAGSPADLRAAPDIVIKGVTNCSAGVGENVKVMVRPENLALEPGGNSEYCMASGLLEDVILVGGVTELRLRLANDGLLTARRLTSVDYRAMERGAPLDLYFSPRDVVVLA